jgi:hypothetical protein
MLPARSTSFLTKLFQLFQISVIRKRLAMIGRNKSVGPDGIPGAIQKMGGEAMIP